MADSFVAASSSSSSSGSDAAPSIYPLELCPDTPARIAFYSNVSPQALLNTSSWYRNHGTGAPPAAYLSPSFLLHPLQLLAAAQRALHASARGHMLSGDVHSEILISLCPTSSTGHAFKQFRTAPEEGQVVVVMLGGGQDEWDSAVALLGEGAQWEELEPALRRHCNVTAVKKLYGIPAGGAGKEAGEGETNKSEEERVEEEESALVRAMVLTIATKNINREC